MDIDVLIAGGGPGGLASAESAARAGCTVHLVEQNKEIGSPLRTTGGSFIKELKDLGIPEKFLHPIHRCRFLSPNNEAAWDYKTAVACVMDVKGVYQFLACRAIDAGAQIKLGVKATAPVIEDGYVRGLHLRDFAGREWTQRSKLVIDASGYQASLMKQAGVHKGSRRFGVGAEYDLYAPHYDQSEAVLIVGSKVAPSGYAWFFPWGNHRVRAGVGIIHPDSHASADQYLDDLIKNASQFGVNLKGAQPVEYHFGMMPSDGMNDPIAGDGILGVGDAAGQPSALVGEGIRWCIEAGRMAGAAAAQAVHAGDVSKAFLARYERQWNSKHARNLRIAHEINKRISFWDDEKWDRRTELLKMFTPEQFAEALKTNLTGAWAAKLIWSNPRLLKEGVRKLAALATGV